MLLNCRKFKPGLNIKPDIQGNQSQIFTGRTDAEAETPILCPPNAKNWLVRKDRDGGKDWRQKEKGTTEDEMVGWHHQLDGPEFEQAGSWWWTGKPGVLQSMGSQRVRHDWATELDWTWHIISENKTLDSFYLCDAQMFIHLSLVLISSFLYSNSFFILLLHETHFKWNKIWRNLGG